jgi:hypothetical protein
MSRRTRFFAVAAALLSAACTMTTSGQLPSPWAVKYPDSSRVSSGRVVRFAGNYGLLGPSPAVVFRQQGNAVTGEVLVWYRAYLPSDLGTLTGADSAAAWGKMQAAMQADRTKYDSTYGCTAWARGTQEGPAWVCKVPEQHGTPNWLAELQRLDSLVQAHPKAGQGGGRRPAPDPAGVAVGPPPPPDGVARIPQGGPCLDGGSWNILIRDSTGARTVTAPPPTGACPRPDGPGKKYDQTGWAMLRDFIAAVK